ncbi:uncharacterized protein LOC108604461 [Drosophila busckii]|nr:uncharacterized protein LOC108604461 [Drosophila busckii]
MTRLLWPVDIISMTKGLLESSSAHCFHCRTISKELICAISYDMGQCIMQPLVGVDNEEAVVYRLVSAIAMRRDNCAVVAYAVGQLTSSTVHEPDMSIAIRGFAMSQDARESVIDSITRCMLIG